MPSLKWAYGHDPSGEGFFCPQLVQKRRDYFTLKIMRPAEAETVYQCRPGARVGSIFVTNDFRYYEPPPGLELGMNSHHVRAWVNLMGGQVVQGWDTAISAQSGANWTVGATGVLVPCQEFHREGDAAILGQCDDHYDVYIVDIFRAKLDIGDLAVNMRQQAAKWNPERIVIEKRAHGAAAIQALYNTGLPVEGVGSQENKRERAINGGAGAGSAQGWYRSGRVLHPTPDHETRPWVPIMERELKDFTGEKGGTDDQVDAIVHLLNYAIVEGSITVAFPTGWNTPEEADQSMQIRPEQVVRNWDNPVEHLIEDGLVLDPFSAMCGRCKHFKEGGRPTCTAKQWMVSVLHPACELYDDGSVVNIFPKF